MDVHASEKEQIENLKKWWKENGSSLITGALLGLSLLFGGKTWMNWKESQAQNASNIYAQMEAALKRNELETVRGQANELIGNYTGSGYATLAALTLGKLAMQDKEPEAARAQLEWALEHARSAQLGNIARTRLIRVLIDSAAYDAADAQLKAVVDPGEYRYIYAELRGDLAWARGDEQAAAAAYREALDGLPPQAPNGAYLRVKYENLAGTDSEAP